LSRAPSTHHLFGTETNQWNVPMQQDFRDVVITGEVDATLGDLLGHLLRRFVDVLPDLLARSTSLAPTAAGAVQ